MDEWHVSQRHVFYHIHAYAVCAIHYFTMIFDPTNMGITPTPTQLTTLMEQIKPMSNHMSDDEYLPTKLAPSSTQQPMYQLPTLPPVLMILREFIVS